MAVLIVSLLVNHGHNIGKAGLYSIFVTQSNDFALGYPILKALYGQNHPEYPSYLYLLAPISLAILNPIGCILMEIDKVKSSEVEVESSNRCGDNTDKDGRISEASTPELSGKQCQKINATGAFDESSEDKESELKCKSKTNGNYKEGKEKWKRYRENATKTLKTENGSTEDIEKQSCARVGLSSQTKTVCKIIFGIFSNPIIILTFAGLIFGQFVFHGHVPPVINNFLQTLKSAYSATALFSLGLGMVRKIKLFKWLKTILSV